MPPNQRRTGDAQPYMKPRADSFFRLIVGFVAVSVAPLIAAQSYGSALSGAFRVKVDTAMAMPDPASRVEALNHVLQAASTREVFYVIPVIFSQNITRGLQRGSVCSGELASVRAVYRRYPSEPMNELAFLAREDRALRSSVRALIDCSGTFYAKGYLAIPANDNTSTSP